MKIPKKSFVEIHVSFTREGPGRFMGDSVLSLPSHLVPFSVHAYAYLLDDWREGTKPLGLVK